MTPVWPTMASSLPARHGRHSNAVYKLMLNQYGDQLISVGLDKTIVFGLHTGEPLRVLRPPIGQHVRLFVCGRVVAMGKPGGRRISSLDLCMTTG